MGKLTKFKTKECFKKSYFLLMEMMIQMALKRRNNKSGFFYQQKFVNSTVIHYHENFAFNSKIKLKKKRLQSKLIKGGKSAAFS